MKKIILVTTILTLFLFLSVVSCKKNTSTPPDPNEQELITTVQLTLVDSAGIQPTVTAVYNDPDGDGGNAPIQWDTIRLKPKTTYNTTILLLDESGTPTDTISNEVWEERSEHLFCFTTTGVPCTITRTDSDGTYEVGLSSRWNTTTTGLGNVEVILKHQPGLKNGSCSPGSTDVDITFPLKVQ